MSPKECTPIWVPVDCPISLFLMAIVISCFFLRVQRFLFSCGFSGGLIFLVDAAVVAGGLIFGRLLVVDAVLAVWLSRATNGVLLSPEISDSHRGSAVNLGLGHGVIPFLLLNGSGLGLLVLHDSFVCLLAHDLREGHQQLLHGDRRGGGTVSTPGGDLG